MTVTGSECERCGARVCRSYLPSGDHVTVDDVPVRAVVIDGPPGSRDARVVMAWPVHRCTAAKGGE